jgi:hypothetical protein
LNNNITEYYNIKYFALNVYCVCIIKILNINEVWN